MLPSRMWNWSRSIFPSEQSMVCEDKCTAMRMGCSAHPERFSIYVVLIYCLGCCYNLERSWWLTAVGTDWLEETESERQRCLRWSHGKIGYNAYVLSLNLYFTREIIDNLCTFVAGSCRFRSRFRCFLSSRKLRVTIRVCLMRVSYRHIITP